MRKLFLGLVSLATILIACGDDSSSGNSADVNVPKSSAESADTAKNKAKISYGTMTDARDGKEYKTITAKMFDGKDTLVSDTWMLEDLAYDEWSVVKGAEHDTVRAYTVENGVYVYSGSTITAGECFDFYEGGFSTCKLKLPFQGICPDGWHLPDSAEADRWRNFLKNDDGVGGAFYRSSSSEECDYVDYL